MDKIEDAHSLSQQDVRDLSFENFVDFIRDSFIFSDKVSITRKTFVEEDLRITGDDGDEFLLAIQDEFGIDFRDETGSIRKAFDLKDNEYLFHSEGSLLWISHELFKSSNIVPFTVGQLYDVVVKLSNEK